jgi:hypothetical protein
MLRSGWNSLNANTGYLLQCKLAEDKFAGAQGTVVRQESVRPAVDFKIIFAVLGEPGEHALKTIAVNDLGVSVSSKTVDITVVTNRN